MLAVYNKPYSLLIPELNGIRGLRMLLEMFWQLQKGQNSINFSIQQISVAAELGQGDIPSLSPLHQITMVKYKYYAANRGK